MVNLDEQTTTIYDGVTPSHCERQVFKFMEMHSRDFFDLVKVSPKPIITMKFVLKHLDKKIAHLYVHLNWLIKHASMAILMVISP